MDEPFSITVSYKGHERNFGAQLFTFGYTYKICVTIDEIDIDFERDDRGTFRAIAIDVDDKRIQKLDGTLLQAIAEKIEEILS